MPSFIRASHVFLLAILAACAGRSPDTDTQPASSAMVQVENQGFADGNRTPVSEEMSVQPGDLVTLTIPPH